MATDTILEKLKILYPEHNAENINSRITTILNSFKEKNGLLKMDTDLSEKELFLITYGDSIYEEGKTPLESLTSLMECKVKGLIPNIHLLPFYPYSSDDGFSVIDYFKVNPDLGDWNNINKLAKEYNLMFDGVINHISAQSEWFQGYLKGEDEYKDFFIEADPNDDLSHVTRPRALPLLTEVETSNGTKHVWTTFSADQIDLNYKSPELFIRVLELILFYIDNGATFLRLDAIGFMWKTIGTNCIHLPETHLAIQLYRQIIEEVAVGFVFISETNVPHKDNISYFGNGYNEAAMVYQFPLPPLVVNAIINSNSSYLSKWAATLETPSDETTFFNFLASHDGIGLNPIRGIIPEDEILQMAEHIKKSGGLISNKKNPDGSESPYEMNISLFNALSNPDDSEDIKVAKFITAHGIQCSLMGVPALYIHSLFGSQNYYDGVKATGRNRSINREKLEKNQLLAELEDSSHRRNRVYSGLKELLTIRTSEAAFHPNAKQEILDISTDIFVVRRTSVDGKESIMAIFNLSVEDKTVATEMLNGNYTNIFTGEYIDSTPVLKPYSFVWLKKYN